MITGFRQTWKTWKTQGIFFEGNYFDFIKMLIGISHVFTSFLDCFFCCSDSTYFYFHNAATVAP